MHEDYLLVTAQISGALLGFVGLVLVVLYMLFGVTRAILEGRGGKNRLEPIARHLLSAVTVIVVALDIVVAAGLVTDLAPLAYELSVMLMIGVSVSYFIPLVLIRPEG